MEIGPVSRPGLTNVGSVSRVYPTSSATSVGAQMPATAVEQAQAARRNNADAPRSPMSDPDAVDRQLNIDPATQAVVFQAVDKRTGDVVRQFPDVAILRLRAYVKESQTAAAPQAEGTIVSQIA